MRLFIKIVNFIIIGSLNIKITRVAIHATPAISKIVVISDILHPKV